VLAHFANISNVAHYARELEEMYRHRRRIFVELLGWRALERADGREIDAYDDARAHYIMVLDDSGACRASARLLPTSGPHMMGDLFAAFVDGPVPAGPDIFEWSRHCPGDPAWPPEINEAARLTLHLGILEFALMHGVTGYTALMERGLARRARSYGWDCTPLGPPRSYGEGEAIAVLNPVRAAHLAALRARAGVSGPVLVSRGAAAA
jgi:acyl-homoserine lactone synthase